MTDEPLVPGQTLKPEEILVCGRKMTISAENFYCADFQGRKIYFCTKFCLETFLADPERFYNAHSRKKE
jgi:YHS domain-containing protein